MGVSKVNLINEEELHDPPLDPVAPFSQSIHSAHREALAMNIRMCSHRCERFLNETNDVFCRCGEDLTE